MRRMRSWGFSSNTTLGPEFTSMFLRPEMGLSVQLIECYAALLQSESE